MRKDSIRKEINKEIEKFIREKFGDIYIQELMNIINKDVDYAQYQINSGIWADITLDCIVEYINKPNDKIHEFLFLLHWGSFPIISFIGKEGDLLKFRIFNSAYHTKDLSWFYGDTGIFVLDMNNSELRKILNAITSNKARFPANSDFPFQVIGGKGILAECEDILNCNTSRA